MNVNEIDPQSFLSIFCPESGGGSNWEPLPVLEPVGKVHLECDPKSLLVMDPSVGKTGW